MQQNPIYDVQSVTQVYHVYNTVQDRTGQIMSLQNTV